MAAPRAVKDSDTALWLHNKLGSAEELWVSSSVGGIIKTDTIDNIYRCFTVLTSTVKLKLLLGILHLPRRNLDEMKHTIDGLIELALEDTDQWVRLVADVVKTYPLRGKLNLDLSSNTIAASVIDQLREKVNDANVFATLPLECQYVNKNALQSLVGSQPPPVRHFALKRKPKSAALRVDLMQRSSDASNQVKKEKTVPVKHRDMTRKFSDASPMRGIPKTPSSSQRPDGYRSQTTPNVHIQSAGVSRSVSRFSRSERGTKLLDISEQPVGIREQKRRKKQQQEEENVPPSNISEEKADETPDYAAGLPQTIAPSEPLEEDSNAESEAKMNDEVEENDVDMEEEEYEQDHYTPDSPETNNLSTIDHDPPPTSDDNLTPSTLEVPKTVATEKRPSIDELPVYAMPATPSPYFRPVSSTTNPVTATISQASHGRPTVIPSAIQSNRLVSSIANVISPAHQSSSNTYPNTAISSTSPSNQLSTVSPSRNPPVLLSPTSASVATSHDPLTSQEKQHSPMHGASSRQTTSYSQIQGFYSPILGQRAPQLPQTARLQMQQPLIAQSNSQFRPSAARPYAHPIQLQTNTLQYIVQPNMLPIQQAQGQRPSFPTNPNVALVGSPPQGMAISNTQALQQQLQLQQAQLRQQVPIHQAQMPKKTLTLTREQMDQAQEMFRTANRLTRQEKSIIIGFIAGSRDNPVPDKGDIVQITLSEHEQVVQNAAGGERIPVIVETYFEMNYRTGTSAKKQRYRQYVPRYNAGNVK